MNENSKICDGCYSQRACANIYVSTDSKCPCNVCIVKMIFCRGCDEYTKFRIGAKRRLEYRGLKTLLGMMKGVYMKVKGIVINEQIEEHIKRIYPEVEWDSKNTCVKDNDWSIYEHASYTRHEKLEELTTKYMCGNDDAKVFYFSDMEEGIEAIKKTYPEFEIIETESDDWPFDYDYTRDEKVNKNGNL